VLGVRDGVLLHSLSPIDFRSVAQVVERTEPQEIYNLSGQSSVGLSFTQPAETIESIVLGTLNLLEAVRLVDKTIRFYNAGSSEIFGDIGNVAATDPQPIARRVPMGWPRQPQFPLLPTIGSPMDCSLVQGYCSIMNRHCDPSASLRAR
jgi:GDPmannose 4,6-dehydratase